MHDLNETVYLLSEKRITVHSDYRTKNLKHIIFTLFFKGSLFNLRQNRFCGPRIYSHLRTLMRSSKIQVEANLEKRFNGTLGCTGELNILVMQKRCSEDKLQRAGKKWLPLALGRIIRLEKGGTWVQFLYRTPGALSLDLSPSWRQ